GALCASSPSVPLRAAGFGAPASGVLAEHEPRLPAQAVFARGRRAAIAATRLLDRFLPPRRDRSAPPARAPIAGLSGDRVPAGAGGCDAQRSAPRLHRRGAALLPDAPPGGRHPGEGGPRLDGRADLRKPLWTLLMFQLWRKHHAQAVSLRSAA